MLRLYWSFNFNSCIKIVIYWCAFITVIRNFDDCIYCDWSHHSCYLWSGCHCAILQTPIFWKVLDDKNNYVLSCYLKKKC